jgi:preprotein translocase subunit SecA
MKRFGGEKLQSMMLKVAGDTDEGIQGWAISNSIERAQKRVEGYHFDMRKHVLEFDDVLNKQREVIYGLRERVLGKDLKEEEINELLGDVLESIILSRVDEKTPVVDWDLEALIKEYSIIFGPVPSTNPFKELQDQGSKELAQVLFDELMDNSKSIFEQRRNQIGNERMIYFSKVVYLQAINHFWKDHLTLMDHLREGVYYKRYMQKNPLHEYQREGYEAFEKMMYAIQRSVVQHIMLAEIPTADEIAKLEDKEKEAVRRREESAKEIHENASLAGSTTGGSDSGRSASGEGSDLSGNRKQRRAQQKLQGVSMAKSDYAPTKVPKASKSKQKKK